MTNTHVYKLLESFKRGEVITADNSPVPNFSQRMGEIERMGYVIARCALDNSRCFKYWLVKKVGV